MSEKPAKYEKRLALGNHRFLVQVWLLAMRIGELSAVIARLMSKCLKQVEAVERK